MTVSSQGLSLQQKSDFESIKSKFKGAGKEDAFNHILGGIVQAAVDSDKNIKAAIARDVIAVVLNGKSGQGLDPSDF